VIEERGEDEVVVRGRGGGFGRAGMSGRQGLVWKFSEGTKI